MNLARAFGFVFDDSDWWQVIVVVGLLQLVPIVGLIVALGCTLYTARAVASGSDRPLPRLNQLGVIFSEGLYGALIAIVYYLPILVFMCLVLCLSVAVATASGGSDSLMGTLAGLGLCLNLLIVLLAIVLQILFIVGSGRYVQTGSVGAALQLGEVIALLRRHPAEWLVLWLLSIVCGLIAGLGAIVLFIGVLFTTAYVTFVFGHLLGQTVRAVSSPPSLV